MLGLWIFCHGLGMTEIWAMICDNETKLASSWTAVRRSCLGCPSIIPL